MSDPKGALSELERRLERCERECSGCIHWGPEDFRDVFTYVKQLEQENAALREQLNASVRYG